MKTVPIAVLVDGIIEIALGLDCGHVSARVRCGEASRLAEFLLEQLELTEEERFEFMTFENNLRVSIIDQFDAGDIRQSLVEVFVADGVGPSSSQAWIGVRVWMADAEIAALAQQLRRGT